MVVEINEKYQNKQLANYVPRIISHENNLKHKKAIEEAANYG